MGLFDRWRNANGNGSANGAAGSRREPAATTDSDLEGGGGDAASQGARKKVTWAAAGLERSVTLKSESSRHYQQVSSRYTDRTYTDNGGSAASSGPASSSTVAVASFDTDSDDGESRASSQYNQGYFRYRRSGKNTNSTIDSRMSGGLTSSYVVDVHDDTRSSTNTITDGSGAAAVLDRLDRLQDRKEAALESGNSKRAASADRQQAIVVLGETIMVNRETIRILQRAEGNMHGAEEAGQQTLLELQRQLEVMYRVDATLDANDPLFVRASKDIKAMFRKIARDKCIVACCCLVCVLVLFILIILIRKLALGVSLGTSLGFSDSGSPPPPSPTLVPPTSTTP